MQAGSIEAAKRSSQQRLERPAGSWNEQRTWSLTVGSGGSVVSNVESWGISRRTALRTRSRPQIPRLSSMVWFTTILAMFILETMFVLITPVTILVLVFLETNPVLTMTLETNPVLTLIDS